MHGAKSGVSFTTLTIDTPIYLNFLLARFLSLGGRTQRASLQHVSQAAEGAYTGGAAPDALIVCAGIGARTLGGVDDTDVYPIRGQTVLLRAPWIRFGRTMSNKQGLWTYIIPRRSGDVRPYRFYCVGVSPDFSLIAWSGHCRRHKGRQRLVGTIAYNASLQEVII